MKTSLWYLKNYPYQMLIVPREDADRHRMLVPGEVWNGAADREQAFIITQGRMRIRRWDPARGMVGVETLTPGEIVGTRQSWEPPEYVEEAVAMDDCVGYVLDRREVDYRISTREYPAITFLRLEGWRLRRYTAHPGDLVFRILPERLASTLLKLARQYPGAERENERTLACSPHIRHLADLTGGGMELTRQVLEEWELRGRLDWRQGRLTLKNVVGFYDLARSSFSVQTASPGSGAR